MNAPLLKKSILATSIIACFCSNALAADPVIHEEASFETLTIKADSHHVFTHNGKVVFNQGLNALAGSIIEIQSGSVEIGANKQLTSSGTLYFNNKDAIVGGKLQIQAQSATKMSEKEDLYNLTITKDLVTTGSVLHVRGDLKTGAVNASGGKIIVDGTFEDRGDHNMWISGGEIMANNLIAGAEVKVGDDQNKRTGSLTINTGNIAKELEVTYLGEVTIKESFTGRNVTNKNIIDAENATIVLSSYLTNGSYSGTYEGQFTAKSLQAQSISNYKGSSITSDEITVKNYINNYSKLDADSVSAKTITNNKEATFNANNVTVASKFTNIEGATLNVKDGALTVAQFDGQEGSNLQLDNATYTQMKEEGKDAFDSTLGNVELTGENTFNIRTGSLNIDELNAEGASASAAFVLDWVGTGEKPILVISQSGEKVATDFTYGGTVNDQVADGQATLDQLFDGIQVNDKTAEKVTLDAGKTSDETIVSRDENGNIHEDVVEMNGLLRSAQDLAKLNAVNWRAELTSLSDRMGTLRTVPESAGSWARYQGGRMDGEDIQYDYNSIEVGADKRIANDVTIGMSFGYTKGDADLVAGTSDNNTYKVGFYGSYFNDSGCFLDTMLKIGHIDADYHFNNGFDEVGNYMMTGVIAGIETGHRWSINNFYIEPQLQLTFSQLRSDTHSSNLRTTHFDDIQSLVGRVGLMGGVSFEDNRGFAYAKASYHYDFLGDIEGSYLEHGKHTTRFIEESLDEKWSEVSLGASYQATEALNAFVDVGSSFGGDIDQKWRVNIGARYVF